MVESGPFEKTAIITGGSRGLGLALATSLAMDGWRLLLDARDGDVLRRAAPTGQVTVLPGDITEETHRSNLVEAGGPRLDALVLNASTLGQTPLPPLADYDIRQLRSTFEINVVAQVALAQLALPALRRSGGRLIAVTSDAAVEAYPGWGGYGASKAALEAVVRVLAVEEPHVHMYAFDPGDLRTQMHQDAFPGEDISDRPEPATVVPMLRRLIEGQLPSGRYTAAQLAGERV